MSAAVEAPAAMQPLQLEAGVPPQPAAEAKLQGPEEDLKASLKVGPRSRRRARASLASAQQAAAGLG